jgi:hypothetical protein
VPPARVDRPLLADAIVGQFITGFAGAAASRTSETGHV